MNPKLVENIEELILDGVDRLLAREGYEEVNMDSLAREVGLKKETLYSHFPTKEDLMLSHVDRIVREVVKRLQAIAQSSAPPSEKIRKMLLLRVMIRFDNVQNYAESLSIVLRDLRSALLQRREHYFEAEAKIFAAVLDQGQKSGLFCVSDRFVTAKALIEATNSVLPFNLTEEELNNRARVEKRVGQIADLLVNALVERGRLSPRSRAIR
jgi:AcrR family transcriptional regulator